jgi:hypothetical protein
MLRNSSLLKGFCLYTGILSCSAFSACNQAAPSPETKSPNIKWTVTAATTTTEYDGEKGIQIQTVRENDQLKSKTWAMAMKCSGDVGKAGAVVQPGTKQTTNGPVPSPPRPGTLRTETRGTGIFGGDIEQEPNFAGWRDGLQKACDAIFSLKKR